MTRTLRFALLGVGLSVAACQGDIARVETSSPEGRTEGRTDPATMPGPPAPKPPSAAPACRTPEAGPSRWRRLTAAQYRNTVRDLLGIDPDVSAFLQDTTTGPFATNALQPAQAIEIRKYRDVAEAVAARAVLDLPKLLGCDPKTGEDACASRFVGDFGARAWRRPLSTTERDGLMRVYQAGKEESFVAGIRLVVEATLQAPSFLYLVEAGEPGGKLTGHEVAARLSYALWNSMPDGALTTAAREGRLADAAGVRREAERLMASPRFVDTLASFHEQLLSTNRLTIAGVVTKEPNKHPEWGDTLARAMRDEVARFVQHAFTKGDGSLETLLTAPHAFPDGPLLALYGLPPTARDADGRASISDGSRAGLLTLPAVLAAHPAVPTHYQAIHRGLLVRQELLCQDIPAPPMNVDSKPPANIERLSQQEALRAHQTNPACSGCHERIDPLGFPFEAYDGIGRARTRAADGGPLDTSGELTGVDQGGRFADARGLAEKLARSADVRKCLAKQWFRFGLGRDPAAADVCALDGVAQILATGRGDVRQALGALVASDSFRLRGGNK